MATGYDKQNKCETVGTVQIVIMYIKSKEEETSTQQEHKNKYIKINRIPSVYKYHLHCRSSSAYFLALTFFKTT